MLDCFYRTSRTALVAAGLCVGVAPHAVAQEPGPDASEPPLSGVVVDEATYQPVDSATITLLGTDLSVSTGRWGSFAFPDAPPGQVSLHVSAPGHPSLVQNVEMREGRMVFVQIVLPSVAAVLSELLVRTTRDARSTVAQTAADLVALEIPRTRVSSGVVGKSDFQIVLRATGSFLGNTAPMILIDGVVMSRDDGAFEALERIPASDVESIEVLRGPAAAFLYPYAANGVISIRTRKGTDD